MKLLGRGMLINFANISPDAEVDFNRWYDREHLAERVLIPGFLQATRYVADDAPQKYLALYLTERFEVLSSTEYLERLANQTEWSRRTMAKFQDATRALARVTAAVGAGEGGSLGFVRMRPHHAAAERLRASVRDSLLPVTQQDGVVAAYLLETDPPGKAPQGASSDWFAVADCTSREAAVGAATALIRAIGGSADLISSGLYRTMWRLSRNDLAPAA